MSAKVVPGIPASEFMETDYLADAPQVHLHFLTGPDEYRELGYGRVELCCHGCGAAMLVYYNDSTDGSGRASHLALTDDFAEKHCACVNRHFESSCPAYRSAVGITDLRTRRRALMSPPEDDEDPPSRMVIRVRPPRKKPAAA
ncbi:MAG TPA: hypothetical protein VGK67_38745 [Myxococcales bacterium]|jgi:hypothetical protein